eukprot:7771138-Prorocentrum_lima.AAC.1
MAYSRGFISSRSSMVAGRRDTASKARIDLWLGAARDGDLLLESSSNSTQEVSQAKCNGVFPSSS